MVNFGRRTVGAPGGSSTLSGYGSETFGDAGFGAWDEAGRSLDRAAGIAIEARRRAQQREDEERERDRAAAAKVQEEQLKAREAEAAAAMNVKLEETRKRMNDPAYVSPEGKVQDIGDKTPSALAAKVDPKFRTQVAEQTTKISDDEIKREEKLREAELRDAAQVTDRNEKIQNKALNEVERFQRAVDSRDARVARLAQLQEAQQQRQLVEQERQEVAQLRRALAMDDKVEQARNVFEDDARLYQKAISQVQMNAKENGVKLTKKDMEEQARAKMDDIRRQSGWYVDDGQGGLVFNGEQSPARLLLEQKEPIDVPSYVRPVSPDEVARAQEIRYVMPRSMRDWKPGAWKAAGVDEATAIRMAALGSMQAGRDATSAPAPAASGRKEPVAANTASVGIGSSNAAPVRPPDRRPVARPPATTLAGGGPASAPRPGATPSPTAPAGPSSPAAPAAPGLMARATAAVEGAFASGMQKLGIQGEGDAKASLPSVVDARRRSDREMDLVKAGVKLEDARKMLDAEDAKRKADSDALTAKINGRVAQATANIKDPKERAATAERVLQGSQAAEFGPERAKIYAEIRRVAAQEFAKTGDMDAANEAARKHGALLLDNLKQAEIGKGLAGKAEEWEATYGGLMDTFRSPKAFSRMVLETGIPMAIAVGTGAGAMGLGARFLVMSLGTAASNAVLQKVYDGKISWDDAMVEGATGVIEAPLMDALKGFGSKVKKDLIRKALQMSAGAVGEGVEEVFQTNLQTLIQERRFANKGENVPSLVLGAGMGTVAGGVLGRVGKARPAAQTQTQTDANLSQAGLESAAYPDPSGLQTEPSYPDPTGEAPAEPGMGNLAPAGGFNVSPEDQARMTGAYPDVAGETEAAAAEAQAYPSPADELAPPPTEEEVNAALESDAVALAPQSPEFQGTPVGGQVSAPEGMDGLIPGAVWTKADENTHRTTVETASGPVQLDVQVTEDGLSMTAEDLRATRGTEAVAEGQAVLGTYTPGQRVDLTKRDLVRTLRGTGVATKAHEVLHFLRANGLISQQDWATMKAKYAPQAKAAFEGDWNALPDSSPDPRVLTKENLIEEAAADGFGGYARTRLRLRSAPAPVKAFARVYEALHSAGSRMVGGNAAAFDRLLRGQYAREDAPAAAPAARPATQQAVQAPEVNPAPSVASEGRVGVSSPGEDTGKPTVQTVTEQAAKKVKKAKTPKKSTGTKASIGEIEANASAESGSGGSLEAIRRIKELARKGQTQVVVDRAGNIRPGTEDSGMSIRDGEAFGIMHDDGTFEVRDSRGNFRGVSKAAAAEWSRARTKAKADEKVQPHREQAEPETHEVHEVSESEDTEDFLASLGVTRASVGKKPKPAADRSSLKARFMAERDKNKRAKFLSPLTDEDLDTRDIHLSEDGKVGYTLTHGDKDFGNLFNNSDEKGAGRKAIIEAIKKGARTLDAFDGFLPDLYRKYGWVETARLKFDPAQAPAGWETDPDLSKKPDVVFMVYRGGDRATIESRVGKFPPSPKAKVVRSYDAAKASQNARQDIVKIRENPPAKTVSMDEAKAEIENQNTDLSGLPRKEQLKIMVKAAVKEIQYQMKQRRSGAGWYRGDIRELEYAAKKAFPELSDPEQMGIFKALVAATSFGNKPGPNIEQAFQIYEHFRKTGELMGRQRSEAKKGPEGPGQFVIQKHWSGGPAFGYKSDTSMAKGSEIGSTEDKLRKLKSLLGSWGAVADFLAANHTVRELKSLGFENVEGKLDDVVAGGSVLGPKGGPFMQNITGNLGDLTGDMWFARTFNRLRGTKIVDAPRNPSERALMRDFIDAVAKQMGVSPADAQAMLWFSEKDLYGKLVGGEDFGTYSVSGRQALESMRNKRELDEVGIAPARKSKVSTEAEASLGWSKNSPLNETYDLSVLTPEQQTRFVEEHGKWVAEEAALETGATVEPAFKDGKMTVKISGTADQSRAAAALVGLGLQLDSVTYGKDGDNLSNNWKKNPKGEEYRSFLDDVGHSPEGLDEFAARVSVNRAEAFAAATTPATKASVGKAPTTGSLANTWRAAAKPIVKRLREIKSVGGRPIGAFIADQLEARRRAYEMTAGRMIDRYNEAVGSLKGEGDWFKVQAALDGVAGAKGGLNKAELAAYTEIRQVFNEIKGMAIREDVFTGQGIREYFPHMAEDGTFSDDHAIQTHLEYLEKERPDLLQKLAEENSAWTGLIGDAGNYELAAIDLARNWNKESFFKSNPHLEKFRSAKPAVRYRKDASVGPKYILGAVRRIMDARYLGSKSEVIQQGIRSIRDRADQSYVKKALSEIMGGGKEGHLGTALVRELNALNGLSKLGSAGLAQLTQLVVASSEAAGSSGLKGAAVDIARGAMAMVRARQILYRDAARSGSTFASDSGEAMKNFAGTGSGSYAEKVHRALWRVLGLGSTKLGDVMVGTTYGVRTLDKFARVMADRFGRETYIRALKNGDRALLIELLGTAERADAALKEDKPRVAQIEATWRAGGTDPLVNDRATLAAGSRLALAGKNFADKTQYRTDTQDQPLLFTHPVMKAANTFYSFAYAHWRWNAEHIQAGAKAAKAGDTQTAARHARALVMQHLITGPIVGAAVIGLRSLLTGKGLEEKDEDDIKSFAEAWDAAMNLDTIGSERFWTAHTMVAKFLQGWQYSGGLGYPLSYVERASRATKEYDKTRGLASFAFGSPGEMAADLWSLGIDAWNYANDPSKKTQKAAIRSFYTVLFNHTLPNVLGISSSVRRHITATEDRPVKQLGWLGLFDPQARWTKEHGFTSTAAEEAREEALEKRREAEERAREEEE